MTDIPLATAEAVLAPDTGRRTAPFIPLPRNAARAATLAGAVVTIASTFMSWTYTTDFPGDLTVSGYPGGLQVMTLIGAIITGVVALGAFRLKGAAWLNPSRSNNSVLLLALATLGTTWYTVIDIAAKLGGIANLDPGGFVAAVGSLLLFAGALALPIDRRPQEPADAEYYELGRFEKSALVVRSYVWLREARLHHADMRVADARKLNPWLQRLVIVVVYALGLKILTFGLATDYSDIFLGYLIVVAVGLWGLGAGGLLRQFQQLTHRNKRFAATVGIIAAAAYPFAQNNEHWANLGVSVLIVGTVALGLNIVVGLTGLLDLGYVAFLGVGAYAAALVSGSQFSIWSGVQFPFWAAAITGMAAACVFGVLIGAPTLRLRGDYLAIVTLGFGEIFRIVVRNLDGVSGPKVTNGPNGIAQIPDLSIFGYNLGANHDIGSFTLGRFANYYLLMLVITMIVVLVFTRAADSRIGRSWIAIREDETAATAMGINGFRVKLVAFALGASLAGLAGTVFAHVTNSVVPDPYQFSGPVPPNSAFLLAAVVLGGMGTVSGPIVGAALLYVIPEKLDFLSKYELFAFGLALILIMRFRPEGIIPNRRRQLEFHEDETTAPGKRPLGDDTVPAATAGA
ncbi:branched-chain amino acid ABC transporter permease [Actinacidiphila bryophytorum]|uniref:Amino acid/amide ABC transporter membrane protein 2, HAAT family n=1 Tax=Actinacidiphila bryophytorum TaxID=1436133 RepID=A0A9W4E8A8_9ACTN|nr:branched-chain amino acid ABC transporter permease [Actinacidiphila bryophytorum]MBM9436191.1 branched-chain amino acid ABC transporter permease [Actinacidiphila bryophytorum]MBN6547526.1 branched-chain amino acid ABC transporter permease [Actinacidiphila bryophytorum]CAG7633305.1 Amino acid/amide ABC transporter membrane protein 2, HAAT family [Actinacidiphila bryophytorum]